MKGQYKQERIHYDPLLAALTAALLLVGFIMVVSASLHLGEEDKKDCLFFPLRQLMHIGLGIGLGALMVRIKMITWEAIGVRLFIVGLGLLVLILIPGIGVKVNGSVRWLSLFGLRIQVSEVVKLFSVIFMAGYVTRHKSHLQDSAYGIFKPLLLFGIAVMLLLLEPDMGSSVVILMIAMGMMFLGGAKLNQFVIILSVLGLLGALLVVVAPYRVSRVVSFIDPFKDSLKSGYQLSQALIAFGQGELLGLGIGNGIQKLFYLPEAHTDFLFSVIAEETGLVGVLLVIALFTALIWRAFTIAEAAEKAGKRFDAFIAYGLAIWLGFQVFVNIGVNMGILPTKGLTLPLMSYGGSSMMVMCCGIALLFRVHSETINSHFHQPTLRR